MPLGLARRANARQGKAREGRLGETPSIICGMPLPALKRAVGAFFRSGQRDMLIIPAEMPGVFAGNGSNPQFYEISLGALDLKLHIDIAARGVRIRADLLVGFFGERLQLRLRQSRIFYVQLYRQPEAARIARPDRHVGSDARFAGIFLVLFTDEVERAAETGRIAGGEKMLRRCRSRLTGTTHGFRYREVGTHRAVAGLGVAVSSSGRGGSCSEQRFDDVQEILQYDSHALPTGAAVS
jgi:hypothetical protein